MSHHVAETALDSMNGRPVLVNDQFAVGDGLPINLMSQVRRLASARPDVEQATWAERKAGLMADYGMESTVLDKPFAYADGVAVIPIHGLLINRFAYSWGYVTGYNFIRNQMNAALADPDVTKIVYDVNSYGGMEAGCMELAAEIYASRSAKPSIAMVDSNAHSAAYWLVSAMSKIIVTPTGNVGSIGVVAMRMDVTKMMDNDGVKVHLIYAGDRKVDAYPVAEFTASAKARLQNMVDRAYGRFTSAVAIYRKMDEKVIRETEAGCYDAEEALALGIIDAVLAPAAAVKAEIEVDEPPDTQETDPMTTATPPTETPAAQAAPVIDAAAVSAAAVLSERTRISAIQNCAEATGRGKLASHIALNTSMSAVDAQALLAAAPSEGTSAVAPGTEESPLDRAMAKTEQPNVGAGSGGDGQGDSKNLSAADRILAAQSMATGVDYTKKPTQH